MFSVSNQPPFKEIELMKELVLEIGTAIDDRMREDTVINTNNKSPMTSPRKAEP